MCQQIWNQTVLLIYFINDSYWRLYQSIKSIITIFVLLNAQQIDWFCLQIISEIDFTQIPRKLYLNNCVSSCMHHSNHESHILLHTCCVWNENIKRWQNTCCISLTNCFSTCYFIWSQTGPKHDTLTHYGTRHYGEWHKMSFKWECTWQWLETGQFVCLTAWAQDPR